MWVFQGSLCAEECVVGGGELYGHFREVRLSVGIHEINRGCVDNLSRLFVTKWDSPNGERELATARTTSLLVELLGVAAYLFVGWMCESGLHWDWNMAIKPFFIEWIH